ncbi:MAG: BMP family ABC transporter substrate-binding protein [bacterium]|nr:BMP family ABC transporter substrate-binding protein [bacterium]
MKDGGECGRSESDGHWRGATLPLRALLIVLAATILGACPSDEPVTPDGFRVSVLTSSPRPNNLDRSAVAGLHRIERELQANVYRVHNAEPERRREMIRTQGDLGTDLVFCIGNAFEPVLFSEAASYPESIFVLLPGDARASNVASIGFHLKGAGYIAGVVAANIGQGGPIGVIHGSGPDWLDDLEDGYAAGFRTVKRGTELLEANGPEAPGELAQRGVKVALYTAQSADPSVLTAAKDAGVLLVAADPRALRQASETVFSAVAVDLPEAMVRVARESQEGSIQGRVYLYDLGSGVVQLRMNSLFDRLADEATKDSYLNALDEVTAGIVEIESLGM